MAEAASHERRIKAELLQSAEAIEDARGLRATLSEAAAERGAVIASAGTHPFSRWEHQDVTDNERYRELMEEMRWARKALAVSLDSSALQTLDSMMRPRSTQLA